jgi:hypothetical protein
LELTRLISYGAEYFAYFKNYARRIRDLESYARSMASELLSLNHARIVRSELPVFSRLKEWWVNRSDNRRIQILIASLWLALAGIEVVRNDWAEVRRYFLGNVEHRGYTDLFDEDRADDDAALGEQNLTFIKSAVEQTTSHLDTRFVAWATGLVALSGVVGGVVGALLTYVLG